MASTAFVLAFSGLVIVAVLLLLIFYVVPQFNATLTPHHRGVGPTGPVGPAGPADLTSSTGAVVIFAAVGATGPFVNVGGKPVVADSAGGSITYPVSVRFARVGQTVTVELPRFAFDLQTGDQPNTSGQIEAVDLIPPGFAPTNAFGDTSAIVTLSSSPTGPAWAPVPHGTFLTATGFTFNGRSTGRLDVATDGTVSVFASDLLSLQWGPTGNVVEQPSSTTYLIF